MRSSIFLGLVFIGDNIGRGLNAELNGDPTKMIVAFLVIFLIMDIADSMINVIKSENQGN